METKQYKHGADEDYQRNGIVVSRLYFAVATATNRRNVSVQILAIVVVVVTRHCSFQGKLSGAASRIRSNSVVREARPNKSECSES